MYLASVNHCSWLQCMVYSWDLINFYSILLLFVIFFECYDLANDTMVRPFIQVIRINIEDILAYLIYYSWKLYVQSDTDYKIYVYKVQILELNLQDRTDNRFNSQLVLTSAYTIHYIIIIKRRCQNQAKEVENSWKKIVNSDLFQSFDYEGKGS